MAEILAVESLCGGVVVVVVGSNALLGHSHVRLGCDNIVQFDLLQQSFLNFLMPFQFHKGVRNMRDLIPGKCQTSSEVSDSLIFMKPVSLTNSRR